MAPKKQTAEQLVTKRIDVHLRQFASNHEYNMEPKQRPFFSGSFCSARGKTINVCYVFFHTIKITLEEATVYANWLDAGNIGRHRDALNAK